MSEQFILPIYITLCVQARLIKSISKANLRTDLKTKRKSRLKIQLSENSDLIELIFPTPNKFSEIMKVIRFRY